MSTAAAPDLAKLRVIYDFTEQRYLRSLPLEHFMEATDHSHQRAITIESFAVIHAIRPDIQLFNELLIQYPRGDDEFRPGQVVPDNFVVIYHRPIQAVGSYNTPLQPVGPFLVLEYVSKHNRRKDYDDNMVKYQDELQVPYYLLFYPGAQDLTLFRLIGDRYIAVERNAAGRFFIPELELETALLDGWVRYWFRSELVPLPGDLLKQRDTERVGRLQAQREAQEAQREAQEAQRQTQEAQVRAQEALLAVEAERQARLASEAELARLRDELAKARGGG